MSPKLTFAGLLLADGRPEPVRLEPLDHPALRGLGHRALSDLPPQRFAEPSAVPAETPAPRGVWRVLGAVSRSRNEARAMARLDAMPNHLRADIGLTPRSEPDRHVATARYLGMM
ncbi:hypothetical protein HKCCE3408_03520 [Rhodobacterales bacterium HKCCE3408]|nr:hypothetical protein [Rhodobacterales bacterium HKCCE3408]